MISYTLAKVTPDMSSPLMIQGLKVEKMALHRGSNANMSRKARLKAHLDGKPRQLCHSGKEFCLDGCLRNMNEVCSSVVRVFWEMSCATRCCSASFFCWSHFLRGIRNDSLTKINIQLVEVVQYFIGTKEVSRCSLKSDHSSKVE